MSTRHIFILGLLYSSNAVAEDQSPGLKVKPSISMGGEYRSNLYLDEGEAGGGDPVVSGTAVLLNPVLMVQQNSNALQLKLGAGYGARRFVESNLQNLNTFNDAQANVKLHILPSAPVGFQITDGFSSNNRPVNQPAAESALLRVYDNKMNAGLIIGGSNAFHLNLSGIYNYRQVNGIKDKQGVQEMINQRNTMGAGWGVSWKFLPKTSVFLDGSYLQNKWTNDVLDTSGGVDCTEDCSITVQDSSAWYSVVGIEGQMTPKTLMKIGVGAGGSTYGDAKAADTSTEDKVSGLAESLRVEAGLRIAPTSTQQFRLEFQRAFQDVYFTNYEIYNQVEVAYELQMLDRIGFESSFRYRNDNYDGPVDRTDHRLFAKGGLNIEVMDHMAVQSSVNWRRLASADGIAEIEYDDLGVVFGVNWGF